MTGSSGGYTIVNHELLKNYNTLKISIAENIHLMMSRDVTVIYSEEQNQYMDSVGKNEKLFNIKASGM